MMKKYTLILMTSIMLTIAACGGGGSSSDSSDSGDGDRFTGTQSITVLGETSSETFVMTVSDSTVTVLDEDFTASGGLNGNSFTVVVPAFSQTDDGITCTFNITYSGTLESEDRATGSLSGSAVCDGINFPITGSFAANRG